MNAIRNIWYDKPLSVIIVLAVSVRLVAAFFARGFGMFDDHFLVIEPAAAWTDGYNYNYWLPMGDPSRVPSGHSFFYVGIHYFLISILKFVGITAPWLIMLIVRLVHAAWSIVVVVLGYRIARRYGSRNAATTTGLLLALLWFLPWSSVRNLVETACIPFLIMAVWWLIRNDKQLVRNALFAGLMAGMAFSVRFQVIFFACGIGLALLLQRRWLYGLFYGLAFIISVAVVQGGIDLYVWGRPFAELTEYIRYNTENAYSYFTGEWYNYLLLILGILIPPVSFLLFFGLMARFRRLLLISLPTLVFLLFHMWFPNKQERFIFPILPFVVIAGTIGWYAFRDKSVFWLRNGGLHKSLWTFFWVINLILLPVVSTMFSKKARVESMEYLGRYPDLTSVLLEGTATNAPKQMPMFYAKQWFFQLEMNGQDNADTLDFFFTRVPHAEPRFVLFFSNEDMPGRLNMVRKFMPQLTYETTIEPSFVDKVLHWMNPYNANETIVIFRNRKFYPEASVNP